MMKDMSRRGFLKATAASGVALVATLHPSVEAEELKPVSLPRPDLQAGKPLMALLKDRRSSRSYSAEPIPQQLLSALLWAAFGINRPQSGGRTAPSAVNWQETDIYIAGAEAVYVYDSKAHALNPVIKQDIRGTTGLQAFVRDAPLNFIYVADYSKIDGKFSKEEKDLFCAVDTGVIVQNVYLFCASEGLATVVRGMIDRISLAKTLNLRRDQKITLAQSIGYPSVASQKQVE